MTTIKDLGFLGLTKGQKFKDPIRFDIDYYEIISNVCSGFLGNYFNVTVSHSDGTVTVCSWWETDVNTVIGDYELIEESVEPYFKREFFPEFKPEPICHHINKKKVIVFNLSGYWYCPDCHLDMGTLTDEEFYQAVKEQTGGKPVKKAPPMGQSRRRR